MLLSYSIAFAEVENNIYVICSGKHSGLVLPEKNADITYLANKDKYNNEKYIEYGFGDKEYYMSPKPPSIFLGIRAVLWPTQSVIRVSKADLKFDKKDNTIKLYPIKIDKIRLARLNKYIKDSFKLTDGKAHSIGYSSYGDGNFYSGTRNFYLFNTCNSWVVKALNFAGYDISTWFVITRYDLESRLKSLVPK